MTKRSWLIEETRGGKEENHLTILSIGTGVSNSRDGIHVPPTAAPYSGRLIFYSHK
jgi:hypothetical protein